MPDSFLRDKTVAPLGAIEILSPSDSMSKMSRRIRDLRSNGAGWVLVVDPDHRQVFVAGRDGLLQQIAPPLTVTLPLPDRPDLVIDFDALFAELPVEPDLEV